jgi:hypothetical protein
MDHNFDTDLFIAEIEARPAVWDSRVASYSGKLEKHCAENVCVRNVSRF